MEVSLESCFFKSTFPQCTHTHTTQYPLLALEALLPTHLPFPSIITIVIILLLHSLAHTHPLTQPISAYTASAVSFHFMGKTQSVLFLPRNAVLNHGFLPPLRFFHALRKPDSLVLVRKGLNQTSDVLTYLTN